MTHHRLSRGFTLMELMTVTAIIAILSAVSFPGIKGAMRTAQMNAAVQNAKQVSTGLRNFANDFDGAFPGTVDPVTERAEVESLANRTRDGDPRARARHALVG
ncbi:MAG: prepilin-type N-terminal cleavage/methylation domain-containing protein, partial [Verrucomicrobiales bacterium]